MPVKVNVPVPNLTRLVAPAIASSTRLDALLELTVRVTKSDVPPLITAAPLPELIVSAKPELPEERTLPVIVTSLLVVLSTMSAPIKMMLPPKFCVPTVVTLPPIDASPLVVKLASACVAPTASAKVVLDMPVDVVNA